jgi:hypothetical protein
MLLVAFAVQAAHLPAEVVLTPNPAPANGGQVSVTGCGYTVGKDAGIKITGPNAIVFYTVGISMETCLVSSVFYTTDAGTYVVDVYQQLHGTSWRNAKRVATATLTAVSQ